MSNGFNILIGDSEGRMLAFMQSGCCGVQCGVHEFGVGRGRLRPGDAHPIEAIDDGTQIDLAGGDDELGDTGEPEPIRIINVETNLNEKAFESVEERRCRPLACDYPYVFVDGIYLKRSWGGSFENVAVMVAIGVNDDGCREVIGAAEGFTESAECWRELLSWLKGRGLSGVRMITGDKAAAMTGAIAGVFPDAAHQRCTVALLPQRAGQGAQVQARQGGRDAQGRPRPGVARRRHGEGRCRCARPPRACEAASQRP